MPTSQAELDRVLEQARKNQTKRGELRKLSLGFKHFETIFRNTDGWTTAVGVDGGTEALSSESEDDTFELSAGPRDPGDTQRNSSMGSTPPVSVGGDDEGHSDSSAATSGGGQATRKRSVESMLAELIERSARRTRQAQDNLLRADRSLETAIDKVAGLSQVIRGAADAMVNSKAYKAQVLANLAVAMATAPAHTRPHLQVAFDVVRADLDAGSTSDA
jgi:hypothetical protein